MNNQKHQKKMLAEIEAELNIAKAAIKRAMKIADDNGLCFKLEPPNMAYHGEGTGVGVTYYGRLHPIRKNARFDQWGNPEEYGPYEDGWLPSNQSC